LDFALRQEFEILENTTFLKLDLFSPSGEKRKGEEDTYSVGALRKS
jgi:hypothetical protein